MVAALLTLRSCGGSDPLPPGVRLGEKLDSAVVEVMTELDMGVAEAYAKPLSREVLEAAVRIPMAGLNRRGGGLARNADR
jgi:hypothetical protein